MKERIYHPILDKAYQYDIIGFNYDSSSYDFSEHTLEITFRKNDIVKKLKFIGPGELSIETGFPLSTGGLAILDITNHQLEKFNVQVIDEEASHGAVVFYAKDVFEIK